MGVGCWIMVNGSSAVFLVEGDDEAALLRAQLETEMVLDGCGCLKGMSDVGHIVAVLSRKYVVGGTEIRTVEMTDIGIGVVIVVAVELHLVDLHARRQLHGIADVGGVFHGVRLAVGITLAVAVGHLNSSVENVFR